MRDLVRGLTHEENLKRKEERKKKKSEGFEATANSWLGRHSSSCATTAALVPFKLTLHVVDFLES